MIRRGWPLLLACLACGGRPRKASAGADLSRLPAAGRLPLSALLPDPPAFAVAFRDARERWRALRRSALAAALERTGLLDDLPALPAVERWEAARDRLAELAHLPLPPLEDVLAGPVLVAWLPGPPAGWLWIEDLGADARAAVAFARVLGAVRPSGTDVELEVREGVPLRRVHLGPSLTVSYYLLADRLVASTDGALLVRSLELALAPKARGEPAFAADLEGQARRDGFAATYDASAGGDAAAAAPGLRALQLAGNVLTADVDLALWGAPSRGFREPVGQLVGFQAPSLDLRRAWEAIRPRPADAAEAAVVEDIDRLAATLGRGLSLSIARTPGGAIEPCLVLAAAADSSGPLQQLLERALVEGASSQPDDGPGGSALTCPWGPEGPLCLLLSPSELRIAPRAALLAPGAPACAAGRAATAAPAATWSVREPSGVPLLRGELHVDGSRLRGSWSGS